MNIALQEQQELTLTQHGILRHIGECEGPERIRRLFHLTFPGWTYEKWAKQRDFSFPTVKLAFAFLRTSGPSIQQVREQFAIDCGLPLELVFIDPKPLGLVTD